ncbi:MAG: ABC transporter permease [Streptosporangiaceae bacterium]
MFFLTYLRRELRRRMRQAIFIALGLAVGVGLVLTVTAASAGVRKAQGSVLHALYGVGTDVTVTQAPTAGSLPQHLLSPADAGKTIENLLSPNLGLLSASTVTSIAGLRDVAGAAGGLTLSDSQVTLPSGPGGPPPVPRQFSVDGVDLSHGALGPLGAGQIASGRSFAAADASSDVAVVDSNYAAANKLKAGSTITIEKQNFKIIGVVREPQASNPDDVYIPLARAQVLAGMQHKVNTVYVSASSAATVTVLAKEISKALPSATVTSSASLASEVTGSISSAASLANDLGRWLAITVLVAAFGLASLLTMVAVSRRVREFGTLKALGWRSRRIIAQVMGESIVIGIAGGAAGVGLGSGGAALISRLAPRLSAVVPSAAGSGPPATGGTLTIGGVSRTVSGPSTAHTMAVHLTAPVTVDAVVIAVMLALAGGLVAGSFGGWRASRLRPAAALASVE